MEQQWQSATLVPISAPASRAAAPERTQGAPALDAFALFRFWWADIGPRRDPATARLYRYNVFSAFAQHTWDPVTVSAYRVSEYLDTLKPQHAEAVRSGLRDFFEFLLRRGYRAEDPFAEIRKRAVSRRRVRRGLERDELERLLIAAVWAGEGKSLWNGQRLAWVILAQAMTGLRPSELLTMTVDRIHLDDAHPWIHVLATKTGTERAVPLNAAAREAFRELLRDRQVGRIIPFGPTQFWTKMRRAAGAAQLPPEKSRPYALRHTFATQMLERGVDIRVVSELLGHVDLRHTVAYTQPSDKRLQDAVAVL